MARPKVEVEKKRGLRVKEILKEQEITQAELSRRTNIAPQNLSRMISGKISVTETCAKAISKAFLGEYSVGWILGYEDIPNKEQLEVFERWEMLLLEQTCKALLKRSGYQVSIPQTMLKNAPDYPDHAKRVPVNDDDVIILNGSRTEHIKFEDYQRFCKHICAYAGFYMDQLIQEMEASKNDT